MVDNISRTMDSISSPLSRLGLQVCNYLVVSCPLSCGLGSLSSPYASYLHLEISWIWCLVASLSTLLSPLALLGETRLAQSILCCSASTVSSSLHTFSRSSCVGCPEFRRSPILGCILSFVLQYLQNALGLDFMLRARSFTNSLHICLVSLDKSLLCNLAV